MQSLDPYQLRQIIQTWNGVEKETIIRIGERGHNLSLPSAFHLALAVFILSPK